MYRQSKSARSSSKYILWIHKITQIHALHCVSTGKKIIISSLWFVSRDTTIDWRSRNIQNSHQKHLHIQMSFVRTKCESQQQQQQGIGRQNKNGFYDMPMIDKNRIMCAVHCALRIGCWTESTHTQISLSEFKFICLLFSSETPNKCVTCVCVVFVAQLRNIWNS